MNRIIVIGAVADNPFVEDIMQHLGQQEDYSDLISLKSFLNTEFCPRFIVDEDDWDNIGNKLEGVHVLLVSNTMGPLTRNGLAMRNFLIARAAKDNGAERVTLLEPDLFYSAQDRGPRREHGVTEHERELSDYKKFDGQPFSARLYAELLKTAGVDEVITVHNHSYSVKHLFSEQFEGCYHNLEPAEVYASYLKDSDIVDDNNIVLCAPDQGALGFVKEVQEAFQAPNVPLLFMDKERSDERDVKVKVADDSPITLEEVANKDIVVLDDMVRTGKTVVESCKEIRKGEPRKICFVVTHFYSSREGRINLNDPSIDEIVTTNTIPQVLNRDVQGRLRHKMVVLLIQKWISRYILEMCGRDATVLIPPLYREDMSSKHPRWRGRMGPLFSQST
jgi:ribose-phosphate pyrophosphokinase